jgi:ADP-heptose:LPS heptosyltransferase
VGFRVDVVLDADYPGVGELFDGWSAVRTVYDGRCERPRQTSYDALLAAIPPFYWSRYARYYKGCYRPPDELFFRDEQAYYLDFARSLGCDISNPPYYFLPITRQHSDVAAPFTVALVPGCKTGEMAAKRWPFFPELAGRFDNVTVVGTGDDLICFDGTRMRFPGHVDSLVVRLSLRMAAVVLAYASVVVANDCGLGHVAGALGVPTVLLFGPTPHATLGQFPPNVTIVRQGLHCEPCWFTKRFNACAGAVTCLGGLSVDEVTEIVTRQLPVNLGAACRTA